MPLNKEIKPNQTKPDFLYLFWWLGSEKKNVPYERWTKCLKSDIPKRTKHTWCP